MNLFIGLVFDNNSEHLKKIDNFRRRFDQKYSTNPYNQLTIIPPFELEVSRIDQLQRIKDDIGELIDDHLLGNQFFSQIEFNGITFTSGRKSMIGLTTKMNDEVSFLQESLVDYLLSEGAKFKKNINSHLVYPIARMDHMTPMEVIIDIAKIEFSSPFVLNSTSVSMFHRQNCIWTLRENLYQLNQHTSLNFVNHLWPN